MAKAIASLTAMKVKIKSNIIIKGNFIYRHV